MKSRIYIEAFDCKTSTGENPEEFWGALDRGFSGKKAVSTKAWPPRFQNFWHEQNHKPFSCKVDGHLNSALLTLSHHLVQRAQNALKNVSASKAMGLIFSSTKGAIEDYVWESEINVNPLDVVLEDVALKLNREFALKEVVSNSCASSHASIALAKKWIESSAVSHVLILAGDLIGPFIHSGFQTLKALSVEGAKPFQDERDGLVLGEAFTSILLSSTPSSFELLDCKIFNEAHTVTGASPEGRGLLECIKRLDVKDSRPDFAIAHGTATFLNDQIEDGVLSETQKLFDFQFPITGAKWSVGHTLGASGSVDLIAAIMSLKNNKVFSLHAKSNFKEARALNYASFESVSRNMECALVTSLGFGGTNGALMVKKVGAC